MAEIFVVNQDIKFKYNLNSENIYYPYRGKVGKVISVNFMNVDIQMDDGSILYGVKKGALSMISKK